MSLCWQGLQTMHTHDSSLLAPGIPQYSPSIWHRYLSDGRLAWVMLASHNLSKAAWGEMQKSNFMVRSFEVGVLFLPDLELLYRQHRHHDYCCSTGVCSTSILLLHDCFTDSRIVPEHIARACMIAVGHKLATGLCACMLPVSCNAFSRPSDLWRFPGLTLPAFAVPQTLGFKLGTTADVQQLPTDTTKEFIILPYSLPLNAYMPTYDLPWTSDGPHPGLDVHGCAFADARPSPYGRLQD